MFQSHQGYSQSRIKLEFTSLLSLPSQSLIPRKKTERDWLESTRHASTKQTVSHDSFSPQSSSIMNACLSVFYIYPNVIYQFQITLV